MHGYRRISVHSTPNVEKRPHWQKCSQSYLTGGERNASQEVFRYAEPRAIHLDANHKVDMEILCKVKQISYTVVLMKKNYSSVKYSRSLRAMR